MKAFICIGGKQDFKINDDLRDFMKHSIEKGDYLELDKNVHKLKTDKFCKDLLNSLDFCFNKHGIDREKYYKQAIVITSNRYNIKGIIRF